MEVWLHRKAVMFFKVILLLTAFGVTLEKKDNATGVSNFSGMSIQELRRLISNLQKITSQKDSIQTRKKPSKKIKCCSGKDGNKYNVGKGYVDDEACMTYKCTKKKNKFIMSEIPIPSCIVTITATSISGITFGSTPAFKNNWFMTGKKIKIVKKSPTHIKCWAKCQSNIECKFIMWMKKKKICTLFSSKDGGKQKNGFISGPDEIFSTQAPSTGCLKEDKIGYFGHDIENQSVSGVDACANLCGRKEACKFWTLNKLTKRCYLKTSDAGKYQSINEVSGTKNCATECSTDIYLTPNDSIIISSPGYSENENYPDNVFCEWIITSPPGEMVSFTMLKMVTEYEYDVVKIYDAIEDNLSKVPILAAMSGVKSQQEVISNTKQMRVTFTSDSHRTMKGFEASVNAFKKSDLPKLEWIDLTNLNISFSNGVKETFHLKHMSNLETACIFIGKTNSSTVIITLPLSSSDKCQSLDQYLEISIISNNLRKLKGTYISKNGKLSQVDVQVFSNNVVKRNRNLANMKLSTITRIPNNVQITIQFGYDKGLFKKLRNYERGKVYIEKKIQEIFYKTKDSLQGMLKETNMELLLDKNIVFINEILKINDSNLLKCRKYQHDEKIPIVILVEDDYLNNKKGIAFRSGACRKNNERYGVALIAWRDDGSLSGHVLSHEMGHLIGGIHIEENEGNSHEHEVNDYEDLMGYSHFNYDNVKFWFNSHGNRCYGKYCPSPPDVSIPHGTWKCDNEHHSRHGTSTSRPQKCTLKCEKGFSSVFDTIHCHNGKWSENINDIACTPSVLLLAGGEKSTQDIEIYNTNCSIQPPALHSDWLDHTSFFYQGVIYLCGGSSYTHSQCVSTDSQRNSWKRHKLVIKRESGHSSIVLANKLYLIGGGNNMDVYYKPVWTSLPLQRYTWTSDWITVPNLSYKGMGQCVVKINEDNFAITGGDHSQHMIENRVTKYNILEEKTIELDKMIQGRQYHACAVVEENEKIWIVVAGGNAHSGDKLDTTEKLDTSNKDNTWERLGNLNEARSGIGMTVTSKGVMILGRPLSEGSIFKVELLDWESGNWSPIKQSQINDRIDFSRIVEIPGHLFDCQLDTITDCPNRPFKDNGKWICDVTNKRCSLICDPGFASLYTDTTCLHGSWQYVNNMECLPSTLVVAIGYGDEQNVDIYDVGSDSGKITCLFKPHATYREWYRHISFVHHGTLYMCGGDNCISINREDNIWREHNLVRKRYVLHSSIVIRNKLYLIGSERERDKYTEATSTTLPLEDVPYWTPIPNLSYKGEGQCVVRIDQDNIVITGGYDGTTLKTVTKYNVVDEDTEEFATMIQGRQGHGCVVVEKSGKKWIIVTGGRHFSSILNTTEKLDISSMDKEWGSSGDLNVKRYGHSMAVTEKGIIAIGGLKGNDYLKSVEILNWENLQWNIIEPSLIHDRFGYGEVVEIPAEKFGCQIQAITVTGCSGEYKYNQKYLGGNVIQVPEKDTCHSVCKNTSDCLGWTLTDQYECFIINTTIALDTPQSKDGYISGLKNACQPNCYLALADDDEASTSALFCSEESKYTACPPPPSPQNGNWTCDLNNQICHLECDAGFNSTVSTVRCQNGVWEQGTDSVGCTESLSSRSVYLISGGAGPGHGNYYFDLELYSPTFENEKCSIPLPELFQTDVANYWTDHHNLYHNNTIYICSAHRHACLTYNSQTNGFKKYDIGNLRDRSGFSAIILRDILYIIGGFHCHWTGVHQCLPSSTPLPLTDQSEWTNVPNLDYRGMRQCVAKIDEDRFVMNGGWFLMNGEWSYSLKVIQYNAETGVVKSLPDLTEIREYHTCIVVERENKKWLIVAGGWNGEERFTLNSTIMLDLETEESSWVSLGDLNEKRDSFSVVETERGIIALGGSDYNEGDRIYHKSMEMLDWLSKEWTISQPSLNKPRISYGGAIKIPTSMFNCEGLGCPATNINTLDREDETVIKNIPTMEDCSLECNKNLKCNYWTWFNGGQYIHNCALMSNYGSTLSDSTAITADGKCDLVCPELPQKTHGNWSCNTANNKCTINCDVGYISLFKVTTCIDGIWSEVKNIQCKPIAFIFIYAEENRFYHPTIGGLTCNIPPLSSPGPMFSHIVFAHKNYLYTCGGFFTKSTCYSLNLEDDEFRWKAHQMNISPTYNKFSFVILENMLYIIDANGPPVSTTLPMQEEANFFPIINFTKHVSGKMNCVIKLNEHSFITLWADGLVSKYDAMQQTETQLPPLIPARDGAGCVMITESNKKWIVVSGGKANGDVLDSTERLDLHVDSPNWENMGSLNTPRHYHKMTMTVRGIMAFGGKDSKEENKKVELLNWVTKQWSYVECVNGSYVDCVNGNQELFLGGMESMYFTEVPESKFGCQIIAPNITGPIKPPPEDICNSFNWPDLAHGLVCGNCKALIKKMDSMYVTCNNYCDKIGRSCTGAWENYGDTCNVKSTETCAHRFRYTNDAICECGPLATDCKKMIRMEPDEFQDGDDILICYKVEEERLCEPIEIQHVEQVCNPEPGITTLSTYQKMMNAPRYYRHLGPHFGFYGRPYGRK